MQITEEIGSSIAKASQIGRSVALVVFTREGTLRFRHDPKAAMQTKLAPPGLPSTYMGVEFVEDRSFAGFERQNWNGLFVVLDGEEAARYRAEKRAQKLDPRFR